MIKIVLLLTCFLSHSVYALEMPTQQEIREFKTSQQNHVEASKKLFQSNNEKDQKEGFIYLHRESDEGSAYSTGKIGWAYQMGFGVQKDLAKAKQLYESAAKSGMTYWQYLLAHAYEQGYLGFTKSEEKYQYWLNYEPKIHTAKYECWVANYYDMGIFPKSDRLLSLNRKLCNES